MPSTTRRRGARCTASWRTKRCLSRRYLDAEALAGGGGGAGADAVHPGYGYLAESPEFAEAVEHAGLVWVGPPAAVMRSLGDKSSARRLAEAAGIPVVPGYAGSTWPTRR